MSRPVNFTGFTNVVSGAVKNAVLAVDWNTFNDRLIAFAKYKAKGDLVGSFITVGVGNSVLAEFFNRTVDGLNVLSPYITQTIPSHVDRGQKIYASYIQALKGALNSIV